MDIDKYAYDRINPKWPAVTNTMLAHSPKTITRAAEYNITKIKIEHQQVLRKLHVKITFLNKIWNSRWRYNA